MSVESIPNYGNPNGKLFGVIGETNVNDSGEFYIKSGSDSDTLNVGWTNIPVPSRTPDPTTTPSITPTRTPIVTRNTGLGISQTPSPTSTQTPTPTITEYPVYSRTPSPTPSITPSITPSMTDSATPTPTISETPTQTPPIDTSPTSTPTPTPTPSITPTITITPTSTSPYFSLTTDSTGNGAIWPYGSGTVSILAGTEVYLYAEPNPNYNYSSFSETGIVGAVSSSFIYSNGVHGIYQFSMPSNNCSVTANFELQTRLLQTGVQGVGSVLPVSGQYTYGENVPLTAISSSTSTFTNWLFGGASNPSDGSTTTANSNIYMTDNRVAIACFANRSPVYATVRDDGSWSVNYKNSSGNIVTLNGSVDPSLRGSNITVGCGIEVYSGGGLFSSQVCNT